MIDLDEVKERLALYTPYWDTGHNGFEEATSHIEFLIGEVERLETKNKLYREIIVAVGGGPALDLVDAGVVTE